MTSGTQVYGQTPGYYRKRVWSGNDGDRSQEHGFYYTINESYFPAIKRKMFGTWYNQSMFTYAPGMPTTAVNYTTNLLNCATNKVYGDLTQNRFNAGVFSGEFRDSYRMTCDIVHSVAVAIGALKKGDYAKAAHVIATQSGAFGAKIKHVKQVARPSIGGVAANNYMMTHFGILPLLDDLKGLYDYMRNSYQVVRQVRRHCVHKEDSSILYSGVRWQWHLKALVEVRGRVVMTQLSEMDRLGLTDLATVLWEITRLSWLADWIIPVGNFLSAVNAHNKTTGDLFFVSRMQEESIDKPVLEANYTFDTWGGDAFRKVRATNSANNRSAFVGLPWEFPAISNPLGDNLSRWVTSAALLRQTIGR